MKKVNFKNWILYILIALCLVVILPYTGQAIEFKIANQITLTWNVTDPVNDGEKIEYSIYIAPENDKENPIKLYTGPLLEYTITLTKSKN